MREQRQCGREVLGHDARALGSAHAGGGGDASGLAAVLGSAAGVPRRAPRKPTHKAKRKTRTGCEPAHNATLNILALALIKRSAHFATAPQGMANYIANREAALEALQPQLKGNAAHAAGQPHGPRSGPVG